MYNSQIDPQNMFDAIYRFPDQMEDAIEIGQAFNLQNDYKTINNIVLAGMGGSAIGGDVVRTIVADELEVPFFVSRNYALPNWVDKHTLVICSSYSGNTEESLSAYADAKSKDAMICGISTGGELSASMKSNGYDLITIPGGLQPRAALAYSFIPTLFLLNKIGLISDSFIADINSSISLLGKKREEFSIQESSNSVYDLAKDVYGMIPVIYGVTDTTGIVALRWKGQLCENSKMIAYNNELPEFNHNEIVGWENNPDLLAELAVIWLKNSSDHPRSQARQGITKQILDNLEIVQNEVLAVGKSTIDRFLYLINYGDWLSYWCAILHNTDPSPVKKIDKLKGELEKL